MALPDKAGFESILSDFVILAAILRDWALIEAGLRAFQGMESKGMAELETWTDESESAIACWGQFATQRMAQDIGYKRTRMRRQQQTDCAQDGECGSSTGNNGVARRATCAGELAVEIDDDVIAERLVAWRAGPKDFRL